jgi:hypothetical protein
MLICYLPLPTFKESAAILSTPDLLQSLANTITIISHNREYNNIKLNAPDVEMTDYPGAAMWRGYEGALILYGWACVSELEKRDQEIGILKGRLEKYGNPNLDKLPSWFFDMSGERDKEKIMESHKIFLWCNSNSYPDSFNENRTRVIIGARYMYSVYFPTETFPIVDPIFAPSLPWG